MLTFCKGFWRVWFYFKIYSVIIIIDSVGDKMFENVNELILYTNSIIGKSFKEFNENGKTINLNADKGILGKIIETGFYKYPNNSKAQADFDNLGIELKVSGYKKNKNGTIRAKERIKLSSINYSKVIHEDFSHSKFLSKNKKILFIWYEYKSGVNPEDFIITKYQLYDMEKDMRQIENDYELIVNKIKEGEAHLLSEGMTTYLGACTSGNPNSSSYICEQPFSYEPAKRRAFSLKNSYINGILHQDGIVLEADGLDYLSVEDYVSTQMKKFIGLTQIEILKTIDPDRDYTNKEVPKQIGNMITSRVIGKEKDLELNNDLFRKTKSKIKNMPINEFSYPIERVTFRQIKLDEFEESWEDSEWFHLFNDFQMVVVCYEAKNGERNGYRIYKETKSFYFNEDDLYFAKKSYEMIQKAIDFRDINFLPYPKSFKGQVVEVAPKGVKGDNAYKTFFYRDRPKVCLMLDKDFVFRKLNEK